MPSFTYTGRRGVDETLTGAVTAANRAEAAARLKRMGLFLLSLEEAREGDNADFSQKLRRRVSKQDLAVLISQLGSLLKAGLPLATALKSLQEQMAGASLAAVLEQIGLDIAEGTTLCEAMSKFPRLFPQVLTAAVRAGEEGGMLAEVLIRLAVQLKAEVEVQGRIRGALAYPVFLCVVGALTLVVLLTFVIPRFTMLFATMGGDLPLPTQILLAFSGFMDRYWPVTLIALGVAVIAAILTWKQEAVRVVLDRYVLKAPLIGSIISRSEIARFARTLSELLNSGVPILTSLKIAQGVMKNRCFFTDMDVLRDQVSKGTAVATTMRELPTFSPLVVNMVAVGEQSGQLPELLMEVAEIYEKECERAIQAFTTILGPSLIVVLGGIIAFVITAILLPVFQASTMAG